MSLRRNQTDYSVIANTFGGRAAFGLPDHGRWRRPRISRAEHRQRQGRCATLIGETFDDRTAPGLTQQPDFLRSFAFPDIDWRRPLNARNGGWYRVEFSHYADRDLGAYTFNRLDIDLRQFVSVLSERRVFVGRVLASTSDQVTGQQVPFYLMPTLGGNDSLRGFRTTGFGGRMRSSSRASTASRSGPASTAPSFMTPARSPCVEPT